MVYTVQKKDDDMGSSGNVENTNTEEVLTELWKEVRELSLGSGSDVERLHLPPSPLQFLRDFVMPNKPCIITAGLQHWPSLTRWTNAYLTSLLQNQIVSLHFTPNGRADSVAKPTIHSDSCFVSAHVERVPFPAALQYITGSKSQERGAVAYAQEQNGCFMSEYSLLAEDVETDIPWATEALGSKPEAVNLWIGNERATTSFHKDHYENLYAVVSGEKHFLLLPPTDVHRMYIKEYPAAHYVRSEAKLVVSSCYTDS